MGMMILSLDPWRVSFAMGPSFEKQQKQQASLVEREETKTKMKMKIKSNQQCLLLPHRHFILLASHKTPFLGLMKMHARPLMFSTLPRSLLLRHALERILLRPSTEMMTHPKQPSLTT